MNELGITNIGIVNALVKLTQKGALRWDTKTFTKSSSEAWVPEGSSVVRHRTNALYREVDLFAVDDHPKYIQLEGITVLTSNDHVKELTIPPLVALHRAIEGTDGNLEVRMRRDFLSDLNKLADA